MHAVLQKARDGVSAATVATIGHGVRGALAVCWKLIHFRNGAALADSMQLARRRRPADVYSTQQRQKHIRVPSISVPVVASLFRAQSMTAGEDPVEPLAAVGRECTACAPCRATYTPEGARHCGHAQRCGHGGVVVHDGHPDIDAVREGCPNLSAALEKLGAVNVDNGMPLAA